jgi:hypothetical protein
VPAMWGIVKRRRRCRRARGGDPKGGFAGPSDGVARPLRCASIAADHAPCRRNLQSRHTCHLFPIVGTRVTLADNQSVLFPIDGPRMRKDTPFPGGPGAGYALAPLTRM